MAIKRFLPFLVLLLSGCTVGPNFRLPWSDTPFNWHLDEKERAIGNPRTVRIVAGEVAPEWWAEFSDDTLNQLERDLEKQNLDVRTATARLEQVRAERGVLASNLYPTVTGDASFTRQKPSDKGAFSLLGSGGGAGQTTSGSADGGQQAAGGATDNAVPSSSKIPPFNIYEYGFDASWEIDLFGRVRRALESADASVLSAEETRRDILLTVQAELARDYIQLRGTQEMLRIAKENIKSLTTQRDLTKAQAQSGLTSQVDTTSAEAQLAIETSRLPQLIEQENEQINNITLLLAANPGNLSVELSQNENDLKFPKTVPVGIPSELAHKRPDILAAEANLHAATANIGVAEADFFPRITLMGHGAIQGLHASDLDDWSARTWSFGPDITLPIFEGGRLTRTVQLRKAEQKEAAIAYRKTVLQALHEVDNALTAILAEQKRKDQLSAAQKQQQLALKLATARYKNGISNYLDVLIAQQNLFAVEQQFVENRTLLATDLIGIYKALGGGFN